MGAHSQIETLKGATLSDAYREAVTSATAEYGYDGYNGTISTTRGAFLAFPNPLLKHDAERYAQDLIDTRRVQKWESVGAVRLAEAVSPRIVTVVVDTTGLDWEPRHKAIDEAVKAKLRTGEGIVSVNSVDANVTKTVMSRQTSTFMEYQVWIWNRIVGRHSSMTLARADAIRQFEKLKPEWGGTRASVTVRAAKIRLDSSPDLFSISEEVTKVTTTVTATVAKVGKPLNEWVTAGIYAE